MPSCAARSSSGANAANAAVGAIELEPAAAAEIAPGAGLAGKRLVLGDRAREQRPHQPRSLDQPLRLRVGAERGQPGRNPRQMRGVIIDHRRAFERDAGELDPVRRERRRKNRIALDDAGIAVGGALARPAPVDQRNRQAALDKVDRDRGADNAGSKHDDIGVRQENLRCGVRLTYAQAEAGRQGPDGTDRRARNRPGRGKILHGRGFRRCA